MLASVTLRGRRVAAAFLLMGAMAIAQLQMAGSALAHHPEIDGSVNCTGLVGYASEAWATTDVARRVNLDIRIDLRTHNGSTWSAYSEIANGQYLAANSYRFTGTHQLSQPLPQKIQLRARNVVLWGINMNLASLGSTQSAEKTLPICPDVPGASIVGVECAEGGARINFTNTGGGTSVFQVFDGDSLIDTVSVTDAQNSASKIYPMDENESKTFTVKSGGQTLDSETLKLDCIRPSANITHDCVAGGVNISFTNSGSKDATFEVWKNGELIDTRTVSPQGDSEFYGMEENETSTFQVKSDTFDSGELPFTNDCIRPSANIVHDCVAGGVKIDFTNGGSNDATFEVWKNDALIDTLTVTPAGDSKTYEMEEGETSTFQVKSDTFDSGELSFEHDCTNPAATAGQSCVDGGAQLNLSNQSAELPVEFSISKNDTLLEKITLQPGESLTKTYAMAEDEKSTFSVTAADMEYSQSLTNDCIEVLPRQEVLGQVLGQVLPATGAGSDSMRFLLLAVVLALAGVGLLKSSGLEKAPSS